MLLFTQASVPGTYFLWVLKNCWPCLSVLRSLWTSSQSLKFPFPMVCPFLTKLDQTGLERSASWLLIWERITELQEIWEVRILYPKERKKREKEENIWKRNVYIFFCSGEEKRRRNRRRIFGIQKYLCGGEEKSVVWSGKVYHLWMWSLWGSQKPFSRVLGLFSAWWKPTKQTNYQTAGWSYCKPALD